MKHDILGEIERSDIDVFDGVARIYHGSKEIKVQISRDDQPLEVSVQLAAEVVRRIDELDNLAKHIAARDLRDTYNGGWNVFSEVQSDGIQPFQGETGQYIFGLARIGFRKARNFRCLTVGCHKTSE